MENNDWKLINCSNKDHGCNDVFFSKEDEKHKESCYFKQYSCPSLEYDCLYTTENLKDIRWHCNHWGHYQNYGYIENDMTVNENFEETDARFETVDFFLNDFGELFIYSRYTSGTVDKIWYNVEYIGSKQHALLYYFKLEIFEDEDKKFEAQKRIESYYNKEKKQPRNICIKPEILMAMFNNPEDIYLNLKIFQRQPKVDESVIQQLKCPKCMEIMLYPIRMCKYGHSLCDECFHNLRKCPTCQMEFSQVRNVALETLGENLPFRCMYYGMGCEFADSLEKIEDHEISCEFIECLSKELSMEKTS